MNALQFQKVANVRDITEFMDHYRVVARSVWNMGFWAQPDLRNWDSWDQFEEIKKMLFSALVYARVEASGRSQDLSSSSHLILQVVPSPPHGVPIMVHKPREGDRNTYWDDPVREIKASEAKLIFLDYFDWDKMTWIDFQYYRVRILNFIGQPHLIGREALVEHQYAKVFAPAPS